MLIGQMIQNHLGTVSEDPTNLFALTSNHKTIPTIGVTHDRHRDSDGAVRTNPDKSAYRNKAVIFLVRDPRDVVVSLYFHQHYRSRRFSGTLPEFIRTEPGGIDTIIDYYNTWAENRSVPRHFTLVQYEDLHHQPKDVLRTVAETIGLRDLSDETLEISVDRSSFQNMRQAESQGEIEHRRMKATDSEDTRSYKTRSGKAGTYSEHMTDDDLEYVNSRIADRLHEFYSSYK
jgi:hypothetical protein